MDDVDDVDVGVVDGWRFVFTPECLGSTENRERRLNKGTATEQFLDEINLKGGRSHPNRIYHSWPQPDSGLGVLPDQRDW